MEKPCEFEMTETGLTGFNTGRTRYRICCLTCKLEIHEATTGPVYMINSHLRNRDEDRQRCKAIP